MTWNAHITRQHRTGSSVAEMSVVAVRAFAASLPEAMRCAKRHGGYPAVRPVCFDDPGKR